MTRWFDRPLSMAAGLVLVLVVIVASGIAALSEHRANVDACNRASAFQKFLDSDAALKKKESKINRTAARDYEHILAQGAADAPLAAFLRSAITARRDSARRSAGVAVYWQSLSDGLSRGC